MGITLSSPGVFVGQQPLNYVQIITGAHQGAGEMVAQPVKPEVFWEPCGLADSPPWAFEVGSFLAVFAREDKGRSNFKLPQNLKSLFINRDGLGLASLWF